MNSSHSLTNIAPSEKKMDTAHTRPATIVRSRKFKEMIRKLKSGVSGRRLLIISAALSRPASTAARFPSSTSARAMAGSLTGSQRLGIAAAPWTGSTTPKMGYAQVGTIL